MGRRLYFTARPMEDGLAEVIDDGRMGPRDDPKVRGKMLVDEFGWDKELAKKIWAFGAPPCHPLQPLASHLTARREMG